jgi:hypothetical protein
MNCRMRDLIKLIWWMLVGLLRSRASLEAEILALRHQLHVLQRKSGKRCLFSNFDRLIFTGLYRIAPHVLAALTIVDPQTVLRWHRAGFRRFWRWKSRSPGGRPQTPLEIRRLIRAMSLANPLWGAPRIHGELLKLGIFVGQTSVAKYMARHRRPPSQGWKTFLRNHADAIAIDRPVRCSDTLVSASVWPVNLAARSSTDPVVQRHSSPHCRMAGPATHRGLWLELRPAISHP